MAYGLWNGHVTDDVTWPQRCCDCEAVQSAILATAWLLVFYVPLTVLICDQVINTLFSLFDIF